MKFNPWGITFISKYNAIKLIKFEDNSPFGNWQCSDDEIIQMFIRHGQRYGGEFYLLRSGAKLCWRKRDNRFYLYGYTYQNGDVLQSLKAAKINFK